MEDEDLGDRSLQIQMGNYPKDWSLAENSELIGQISHGRASLLISTSHQRSSLGMCQVTWPAAGIGHSLAVLSACEPTSHAPFQQSWKSGKLLYICSCIQRD